MSAKAAGTAFLALAYLWTAAPSQGASGGRRYLGDDATRCPVTLPPPYLTQDACCGTRGPNCTATTDAFRAGLQCAAATMTTWHTTPSATLDWPTAPPVTPVPTAPPTDAPTDVSRETSSATPLAAVESTPTALALPALYIPLVPRSQRRVRR